MSSEKLSLLDSIEPTDSRTQEGMFLRMFAKLIGFFLVKNIYHIKWKYQNRKCKFYEDTYYIPAVIQYSLLMYVHSM